MKRLDSISLRSRREAARTPAAALTPRAMASNHCHSAVDVESLTGDVAPLGARQIDDRGADVRAASKAPHRDRGQDALALLLIQRIGHRTGDEARRDAVD